MKLAIELGPPDAQWETHVSYALEAERLGIDFAWSPELWGYDAVTPLPISRRRPAAYDSGLLSCRSGRVRLP